MISAPLPDNELERLATLEGLEILDSEPQERFDGVTSLAKRLLDADYVAISLIDESRQWFLSSCGLDVSSTSRDVSFCAHTILDDATLVVEDTHLDERFVDNPLVTSGPRLRAYLGHPIFVSSCALGALCVLYKQPQVFSAQNKEDLRHLARIIGESIEFGRHRSTD